LRNLDTYMEISGVDTQLILAHCPFFAALLIQALFLIA